MGYGGVRITWLHASCSIKGLGWSNLGREGKTRGKGREGREGREGEREGARERRREANMHRRGIGLDVSPYVCGYVGVSGIGMPMCSFS